MSQRSRWKRSLASSALAFAVAGVLAFPGPGSPLSAVAAAEPHAEPAQTDPVLSAMAGGNTYGASVRERAPRADGYRHIDTPLLISRLIAMEANTYTFGIWESPTDWDDLRKEFVPAAQKAGIEVMVYLVPPSECVVNDEDPLLDGRCSRPFRTDFKAWARNIAQLAAEHPNVTSWAIDDFVVSETSAGMFTREYLAELKAITESIRPGLDFYVTLYDHQITDPTLDLIDHALDGVIYPYLGQGLSTAEDTDVVRRLDEFGPRLKAHGMDLLFLVYGGRFLYSNVPPDAAYVESVLEQASPYVADGRIAGIVAYGAPLDIDYPRPSYEHRAHSGSGSLSMSIPNFMPTQTGAWAQASTQIPTAGTDTLKKLAFWHFDQNRPGDLAGYHAKQILVDGEVVWQSDVSLDPGDTWIRSTVDLTAVLLSAARLGKETVTLAVRVYETTAVQWWPIDVRFDDLRAVGFDLPDGGFETSGSWAIDQSSPALWAKHDIYRSTEPVRIVNAIGAAYAEFDGKAFAPVPDRTFRKLEPGPDNRAMYGNGWLELSTTGVPVPAGTCATASQRVQVDQQMPRQELAWWHTDRVQVLSGGILEKRVLIDDHLVWQHDVNDEWPWDYIQGSILQGPIDITHLVQGKSSVTLTLALCAVSTGTVPEIRATFDHIEAIGLKVRNGGFEHDDEWQVEAGTGLTAQAKHAGAPVDLP